MASIVGGDGQWLATVILAESDESRPSTLPIRRITDGSGRLLHYYFSEGERVVQIVLGDFRLAGRLQTKMSGTMRRWDVLLDATPAVPALGSEAAAAEPPSLGPAR